MWLECNEQRGRGSGVRLESLQGLKGHGAEWGGILSAVGSRCGGFDSEWERESITCRFKKVPLGNELLGGNTGNTELGYGVGAYYSQCSRMESQVVGPTCTDGCGWLETCVAD